MVAQQNWADGIPNKKKTAGSLLKSWLSDPEIQDYLRINRYEGILWFNKEALDNLLRGLLAIALITTSTDEKLSEPQISKRNLESYKIIKKIHTAAQKSGYQVDKLIAGVEAK